MTVYKDGKVSTCDDPECACLIERCSGVFVRYLEQDPPKQQEPIEAPVREYARKVEAE